MHIFDIPSKYLNSDIFLKETGWTLSIVDGKLTITGDCTKQEAQKALDAHNPIEPAEPSVADKLASVGLSLDDLKAALGL
jgi:hypothetical protein